MAVSGNRRIALAVAAAVCLSGAALRSGDAAGAGFAVMSPAFADNAIIAKKFGASARDCGGQNVSPPLRWSNAPAGTKSFAIFMVDPEGRKGLGVTHWLAYNIPAAKMSLREGEASAASRAFTGGRNTQGATVYFGPCPPVGDPPHHYTITVLALDLAPGAVPPGLDRDALAKAFDGHSLAAASLIGRYARP